MKFTDFCMEDVKALKNYFYMRPNRACDNAAVSVFIWREFYRIRKCVLEGEAVLMIDTEEGVTAGCLPLCRNEDLPKYFKLQERYFNEVLGEPQQIFVADEEGVKVLTEAGCLENYEVTEECAAKDYLYEGDALRTLAGRKFSKKRNHIHKFEAEYAGRWVYRTLGREDRDEIMAFLSKWRKRKEEDGYEQIEEVPFDVEMSLNAEISGVQDILNYEEVFSEVRAGGIYIDGKLSAFSIGNYNPLEKMAIIDIEKADSDVDGLYQVINQQFLLHEFPEAELINREDDVGLEGLRRSKMSYYPCGFSKKYYVGQKNFPKKTIQE